MIGDIWCNFYRPPVPPDKCMRIDAVALKRGVVDTVEYLQRIADRPTLQEVIMERILQEACQLCDLTDAAVVMESDGLHGHVATGFGQIAARFRIMERPQFRDPLGKLVC